MIHFIKGIIEEIGDDYAAIDVNGVGYQVFATGRCLGNLAVGELVKMHIQPYIREDQFTLYGFSDVAERDVFNLLTKVNGVGMKVGLAILSALSLTEVLQAIGAQDGKMIARANGVGPKLGERIVRELKDKVKGVSALQGVVQHNAPVAGSVAADVLSALENLGYKAVQIQPALKKVTESTGETGTFDALFKATLAELR